MDREDQILVSLGRIEAKVDDVRAAFIIHIADDKAVEERVRKVENRQSRFLGIAACLSVFIPALITVAIKTLF